MKNRNLSFNFCLPLILLLLSCGKKTDINGKVVDPIGNGMQGVSVMIENSSFKSVTDENGNYSIDYAPGSFKLIYSKSGYTTHELELNLSTKVNYPADSVVMYPIPENEGIYFLDGNRLVSLCELQVKEREWSQSWPLRNFSIFYIDNLDKISKNNEINEGQVIFIDTYPQSIKLARLSNNGYVQSYSYSFSDTKYDYNGILNDKSERFGEEKILLRSAQVKPGIYAWVQVGQTFSGYTRPISNKLAFAFKVVPITEN